LVYLLILLYVVFYSWLSILRHQTFQSNAMDLGYTDQAVWNTLHGRFLRFSTLENAPIDLPLDRFRRTDILLAYHVELILAPISLLYLIYDSPVTLLLLQTIVIGLGALPAYWLARDRLTSDFAGLTFAIAYLLAPAIEGANLSDFHGVSLTASLLLFCFYWLQTRRYKLYFGTILICMLAKEDIPLLLVMMGLYIVICRREFMVGVSTASIGLAWFLICTQVILPHFSGLPGSPFLYRVTIFGPTLKASLVNLIKDPILIVQWLLRPEITRYLGGLLASAGFMSLFSPLTLGISAPVVAMNVFSTWDWTYSEGAHYSASILPIVIVSGIYGTRFLARQISARTRLPYRHTIHALAGVILLASGIHHYRIGISPWSRSYHPFHVSAHDRLGYEMMEKIPRYASVSTQSGLYPHLAHRERAYFFPAVNDAEYILLDVTGPSYPITVTEVHEKAQRLLHSKEFGVLAAQDGYLLLQRGLPTGIGESLPAEFYTFAQVDESDIGHPLSVRFGDEIELLGYDYTISSVVNAGQTPVIVTTYWRALQPQDAAERLVFFFTRQDGAIVYHYEAPTTTAEWLPIEMWSVGKVIRVQTPVLSVGRLKEAIVAVVSAQGDPWSAEDRLVPVPTGNAYPIQVYDQGTLLKLLDLP